MFTLMRTHQRKFWMAITVLLIISFISFYSVTDHNAPGSGTIARVYKKDLSSADFQREARKFQLTLALGLTEYATALGATGSEESYADFVINKIILDHQGRALGIQPTDNEIALAIAALPVFQTGGQFDRKGKYEPFLLSVLPSQGFTELEIQELVRNSIIVQRIKQILDSVPAVTPGELAHVARVFQPVTGVAVLFDRATYASQVKLTDEQVATAFKAGEGRFTKPEIRTARYVTFPLPTDAAKLEGKAKIEAQQKVADASDTFATRAATDGFEKTAKAAGLKIETTPPFNAQGQLAGMEELAALGNISVAGPVTAIAPAAFTLTKKDPVTGVLQSGDSFVVAELADVTPGRPMTLDEAKPEITRELTDAAAQKALDEAATIALAKLRAAAKAGQPIAAATAAGLKTQPFTNVLLTDEAAPPEQRRFAEAALVINDGEVSGFRSEPAGGYAVWLEKRSEPDAKKAAEQRTQLDTGIIAQRQNVLWAEWIRAAQKEAGSPFFTREQG